MKLKAILTTAV